MNFQRSQDYISGIAALPEALRIGPASGKNGETFLYDEAEVWKRVLDYRIVCYLQPSVILETHRGQGLSRKIFDYGCPLAHIYSCDDYVTQCRAIEDDSVDLVDIDPFGQPYDAFEYIIPKLKTSGQAVVMITNGEMLAVTRGLLKAQRLKSPYKGKNRYAGLMKFICPV